MNKRTAFGVLVAPLVVPSVAFAAPVDPPATTCLCPLTGREIPLAGWGMAYHAAATVTKRMQAIGYSVKQHPMEWPQWSEGPLIPLEVLNGDGSRIHPVYHAKQGIARPCDPAYGLSWDAFDEQSMGEILGEQVAENFILDLKEGAPREQRIEDQAIGWQTCQ